MLINKYKVTNVVIDSSFRNQSSYPLANDFVVYIGDVLKNVVAIRILKTEFTQSTSANSYFVINSISIPLQVTTGNSAYLYLNNYDKNVITDGTNGDSSSANTFFGRVAPGSEIYPAINGNVLDDPFTYILNPPVQKMSRFHIKLLNADRSLFTLQDNASSIIITLAVYCRNDTLPIGEERHHNTIPLNFRDIQDDHSEQLRNVPSAQPIYKTAVRRESASVNRTRGSSATSNPLEVAKLNEWFDKFIINKNEEQSRRSRRDNR